MASGDLNRSGAGHADAIKAATIAPVSRALEVKVTGGLKAFVELALAAIDSVHRDGALPRIPIEEFLDALRPRVLGEYKLTLAGEPALILVRDNASHWPALTAVHEIGHFLDHWVLGKQGEHASNRHPALQEFRDAVDNSQAVKHLRSKLEPTHDLIKRKELWARAYAQYVAHKSCDSRLLEQVAVARQKQIGRQWEDGDFSLIEKAIDKIFDKKGWRE